MFHSGLGYSSINLAKTALSSSIRLQDGSRISENGLVSRFCKGVFRLKPPVQKHARIWDTGLVITYIKSMGPTADLTLKLLTHKLAALMMLLSQSRVNFLCSLMVDAGSMDLQDSSCTFYPTKLLKHSRPTNLAEPLTFFSYPADVDLCVLAALRDYLARRALLTNSEYLFVSYVKPHYRIHNDTMARWLKNVLHWSGVDTSTYSAHSFRSASSSKAHQAGVGISDILKQGQWKSQQTWQKYYFKTIDQQSACASAILD